MEQVIVNECAREIEQMRKKIIAYVKRYGTKENLGQREVRLLMDKYSCIGYYTPAGRDVNWMIARFSEWCSTYTGE